jgi:hypothetical protein
MARAARAASGLFEHLLLKPSYETGVALHIKEETRVVEILKTRRGENDQAAATRGAAGGRVVEFAIVLLSGEQDLSRRGFPPANALRTLQPKLS